MLVNEVIWDVIVLLLPFTVRQREIIDIHVNYFIRLIPIFSKYFNTMCLVLRQQNSKIAEIVGWYLSAVGCHSNFQNIIFLDFFLAVS